MANKPLSMIKIRHILVLHSQGRSKLQIAALTGTARNTIKKYIKEFSKSQLTLDDVNALTDKELEDLFIKPDENAINDKLLQLFSLFPDYNKKLIKKGVTRLVLWDEYKKLHPDGLARSQFNHYFALWRAQVNPTMKMNHKAGDKLYVDFAGDKLQIIDPFTGEVQQVEVFVAILGASQLTYVEAVPTQQKEDFIAACENAIHYCGGVPAAIVPDNLRSAVTKSSKYEPVVNETFADFAQHYQTAILPARTYRPRDKALVENAVRIIYSRIYAKLRSKNYFSLADLNADILIALEEHNNATLRGRDYSRRAQWEEIEKAALMPLPPLRYELKKVHFGTVTKFCHVSLGPDKHYYSVPSRFIGNKVKLLYSKHTVEVFYNYERIAIHNREKGKYQYTTDKEHLPSHHRFVTEWSPEKFINMAAAIHEDVKLYIIKVLGRKQHPEQAYKSCMGILAFAKKVGTQRLIKACQRGLGYGAYNYKTIEKILKKQLDFKEDREDPEQLNMPLHDNIRGEHYYQ
jgi:transposase